MNYYMAAIQSESFSHVAEDLAVSSGGHDLTHWPTIDLVDRRSRFEKCGISILRTVTGIADVTGDLGLHMPNHWTEVGFLKCRRRSWSSNVLGRTDLDEVDPFDLDRTAVFS